MELFDIFFPKYCVVCKKVGKYLCDKDKAKIKPAKSFCPVCTKAAITGATHAQCKTRLSLDGLVCLFDYSSPIKEIIQSLKYRFVQDLKKVLVSEVGRLNILDRIDFDAFILLPIPLSSLRQNWRGFNQTEVLGEIIAKKLKIPFEKSILLKSRETKPQATLTKKERSRQIAGVFQIKNPELVSGKNFIVFDDVWTTGATMKAAVKTLKYKKANKVWGITLANSH